MARPKLTPDQRHVLLEWLAADYAWALIRQWFQEREWPILNRSTIHYYRTKYGASIDTLRAQRRFDALNTGLALKAERVKRLVEHADALEAIKWIPGDNGRLYNEKAWRETLDDIASEVGDRRIGIDANVSERLEIGVRLIDYRSSLATLETGSTINSDAPGESEVSGDGETLGQDHPRRSVDVERS